MIGRQGGRPIGYGGDICDADRDTVDDFDRQRGQVIHIAHATIGFHTHFVIGQLQAAGGYAQVG